MLDLYRFALAVFVVQAHIPWPYASGPLSQHAVFSFYVLSGFLMTLILNETYGFGPGNFLRFWSNRFLRLYPAYIIVIALTGLHILLISPLTQLHPVTVPQSVSGWVANLSMFGMAGPEASLRPTANFIPNAWSLSVELFCYLLLAIYFARTPRRALALLLIGIAITGAELARVTITAPRNYDFQNHYGVLQAGIIPFAAGSLAWFHRRSRRLQLSAEWIPVLLIAWAINFALAHAFDYHRFVTGLFVAVAINTALVPTMFAYDEAHRKPRWVKVMGGISYPVFVSHILVGTMVFNYTGLSPDGYGLFPAALAATIALSLAIHLGIERNVDAVRTAIKLRQWPFPHMLTQSARAIAASPGQSETAG